MSDRLGMIRAIHEQPADDLPRLAYADWLEERGEADHAEFIRVEVALSHLSKDDDAWRPTFERELELIRAHKDEWFGTARKDWVYDMRRGFIEEVWTRVPSSVIPHADWLFSHHSLQELTVTGRWAELRRLLAHPLAGVLARLRLDDPSHCTPYGFWAGPREKGLPLARRPLALSLAGHNAGPALADELLAAPHLGRLAWLDLAGNALTAAGLKALLDGMDRFPRLAGLCVPGRASSSSGRRANVHPNVDRDGVLLLASHPAAARLAAIDLADNRIDPACVRALIGSPYLGAVTKLRVGEGVGRAEARRLRARFGDRVEVPGE